MGWGGVGWGAGNIFLKFTLKKMIYHGVAPPKKKNKKNWRSILKFEVQKMKVIHLVISLPLPLPDGLGFHDLRTLCWV